PLIGQYIVRKVAGHDARQRGVLYVGTDDGRLRVSMDDGKTWTDTQSRLPGLPASSWVAGIEASRHADGTVYVVFDNHRSNDFKNYIYKSMDFGQTWTAITGDMPADRVARTIREDPRNANLLYVGAEFGVWISPDSGQHWIALQNNMPTLPFNDLVVHARDNDLVLASHGRGIWILDNVNALQGLTPETTRSDVALFLMEPAYQIRYTNLKAHTGDMIFRGENPPHGAIIDYWLGRQPESVTLEVRDEQKQLVQTLRPTLSRGVNRVVWNLRHANLPVRAGGGGDDDEGGEPSGLPGPLVRPGTYTVFLTATFGGGRVMGSTATVNVLEDPRINISDADHNAWSNAAMAVADMIRRGAPVNERMQKASGGADVADLKRQWRELMARMTGLYGEIGRWTGRPTADQMSEMTFYGDTLQRLVSMSDRY
ncbi:MAG: WD40/YVTN/BNR-like repeat-containing protein, partial [Vicinamibacterales bacterium]